MSERNGCYDRKDYNPYFIAFDGWHYRSTYIPGVIMPMETKVSPHQIKVRHTMTTECQYTKSGLGKADPKCAGCKHQETLLMRDEDVV